MENNKIIRTGVAELSLDPRGFVRIKLLDTNADFDVEEAKKQFNAAWELTNGQDYRVLVDTTDAIVTPTKEAEDYISSTLKRKAEALIIKSLHYRILVKFYIRKHKVIPVKAFKTEEEAIEWLLSVKC
jgi:hypothetical protein